MISQGYEDIMILKHAARAILREALQQLEDSPSDDLSFDEIIENVKQLENIAELVSVIRDNCKHLPFKEEEE
jgi:nucleotidyltransferase/DNA polymerase involved in DNA repair